MENHFNITTLLKNSNLGTFRTLKSFNSLREIKQVKRKRMLLEEGNVCRNIYILKKGLVKQYCLSDGKEYIQNIFFEGSVVCDFDSFLNQMPANTYLEATEDCELLVFSYNEFKKECEMSAEIGEQISIYVSKINSKRVVLLSIHNAIERYMMFLNKEAEVLQRIPQYMVASYLCIAPETLSRIRKKISVKIGT